MGSLKHVLLKMDDSHREPLTGENKVKKQYSVANMFPKGESERLDWMYEQSAARTKDEQDDDLMNSAIKGQKDDDINDIKKLQTSAPGSLFLSSATTISQDMMAKIRLDPLFQIKQAEVRRKESILSNPLLRDKIRKKHLANIAKREKKKEKKKKKKKKKKRSSSSSSSSSSAAEDAPTVRVSDKRRADPAASNLPLARHRSRSRTRGQAVAAAHDMSKRREEEELKAKARGRSNVGLSEEDKALRLREMMSDGQSHEQFKDSREKDYVEKEKQLEDLEKGWRDKGDRTVFKKMNHTTYMSGSISIEDRIKSNRHRRQKGLFDPLENES